MIAADISIDSMIEQVGAYAGFAATIGLALFALLLFAQARELKRLREWGAGAHDRMADLERRLAGALELARRAGAAGGGARTGVPAPSQRPVAASGPRLPPAPARTSAPAKLPLLPAAPAGVAAPALASATMAVAPRAAASVAPPVPSPAPVVPAPAPPSPVEQPAAAPAPAPATVAAQGIGPSTTVVPPAAPASGGGNGRPEAPADPPRASAPPPPPPPRPPARPPARPPSRAGAARPAAAAPLRARTPSATPRGSAPVEPPSHRRGLLPLVAGFGALVAVIVALILITSGGGDPSPSGSAPSGTPSGQQQRSTGAPPHSQTVVAVLNGTSVEGLANSVANELAADGFVRGTVWNASSPDRLATVVSYFGGHEAEAAEVARTLGVASDAVQPIDADTEASACPPEDGPCQASVVVTVGADRQQ